jgi:RecB family exonuclease
VDNELRVPALSLELKNGQSINLTGVVDKITRDSDGNITVWDYKTGRSYSSMDKGRKEKIKRQAAFYKLLLQNAFDGKYNFHTATFDFLEINEEKGIYERQSFDITQDDVNEVINMINDLADDVLNGTLLEKDFYRDKETNKGLLEFLEVLRGPVTKEQLGLFD